ncbi:hypothetical protein KFK09_008699 [Dendrobium nobile]|uniref:Uncharacterized protein n=1 Tax=Dendrobium nobile TaxID=94219 RepID=A0A8T3BLV4_DENNO|nr:hypothetical protein KFK09_008699 [Dendrobium nobile]
MPSTVDTPSDRTNDPSPYLTARLRLLLRRSLPVGLEVTAFFIGSNCRSLLVVQENEIEANDIPLEEGEFISMENSPPLGKCIEGLDVMDKDNMEDDGMFMEDDCPQQISQRVQQNDSMTPSTSHYNSDTFTDTEDFRIVVKYFAKDDNDINFIKVHRKRGRKK